MRILPATKALWKIAPRNARPVAIDYGLNKKSIVCCGSANVTFTAGQEIFDLIPLIVSQSVTLHRSAPPSSRPSMNHILTTFSRLFMR